MESKRRLPPVSRAPEIREYWSKREDQLPIGEHPYTLPAFDLYDLPFNFIIEI